MLSERQPEPGDLNGERTSPAAQAAVRQPSTTASGRGDARQGGDSFAILPPSGLVQLKFMEHGLTLLFQNLTATQRTQVFRYEQ